MKSCRLFGLSMGVAVVGLTGCTSTAVPTPPVPIVVAQHLYVPDDNAAGLVRVYLLPISAASTPTASFSAPNVLGIAANATTVAVSNLSANVLTFTQPVTSASTAAATFASSGNGLVGFDSAGNLDKGLSSASVSVFTPPFSNASVPSSSITATGYSTWGVAGDAAGKVYITNSLGGIKVATAGVVTVTVPSPPGRFYRGIAVGPAQVFACDVGSTSGPLGGVDVYNLPLTAASVPVATITTGVSAPEGCAVDAGGTFYVGNLGNSTVTEYAAPFTNASSPIVTLTIPGIAIFDIAVGP